MSTRGGGAPVDFETAILNGFAEDAGLYVPTEVPEVSPAQLQAWSSLSYVDLAFEVLSLYIDRSVISEDELRALLRTSFESFDVAEIIPIHSLKSHPVLHVAELFHGPTLSFKDVALGFLVNLMDFFLARRNRHATIIVATTGDTGPAAAFPSVGKDTMETWVLYPTGFITPEQERQMTTLGAPNVHAVAVEGCPEGGDDLDVFIAELYADEELMEELQVCSVNSVNWGRVLVQAVHYFYAYFQVVGSVGDPINFSVPSGGFGNAFGGSLARKMGLPIANLICGNNQNDCLHRALSTGVLLKRPMVGCVSNAMDMLIPYNFWRYLYLHTGEDPALIRRWMDEIHHDGARFDATIHARIRQGMESASISDERTLATIRDVYEREDYLLDPHGAVAVATAIEILPSLDTSYPTVCLSTAHPAKFPEVTRAALGVSELPEQATHPTLEEAKSRCQHVRLCHHDHMGPAIRGAMVTVARATASP